MIPIECPKCGREGNVPPDRLNAKLTCRGCQAVFHLDNSGRMVMGAPGDPEKDRHRAHVSYSKPGEPFDFKEALGNIPMAVKVGVPAVIVAVFAFMYMPGGGGEAYKVSSEAVVRGVLNNDRARVVSYATSSSADASGKWFDLVHAEAEKQGVTPSTDFSPALFSGNPERGGSIIVMVVLTGSSSALSLNLHLVSEGGSWRLDGDGTLGDAEKNIKPASKK